MNKVSGYRFPSGEGTQQALLQGCLARKVWSPRCISASVLCLAAIIFAEYGKDQLGVKQDNPDNIATLFFAIGISCPLTLQCRPPHPAFAIIPSPSTVQRPSSSPPWPSGESPVSHSLLITVDIYIVSIQVSICGGRNINRAASQSFFHCEDARLTLYRDSTWGRYRW